MPTLPPSPNTSPEIAKQLLSLKTLVSDNEILEAGVIADMLDAICKFADGGIKNKSTLLSLGVIEIVMNFMTSPEKRIRKSAVTCIASCTDLNESIPDHKRLVEVLVSILQTEDQVDILDEAAAALANASKDCTLIPVIYLVSRKVDVVKMGGIKALLRCIEMADPDVKWNSATALSVILDDCIH